MNYEVKLTLFKDSGKYNREITYETNKSEMYEIWDEVNELRNNKLLGDLDETIYTTVDVPKHKDNHPRLMIFTGGQDHE